VGVVAGRSTTPDPSLSKEGNYAAIFMQAGEPNDRGICAPSKVTSFPRKRESIDLDPRFRGGDEGQDFHVCGWATGPWTLGMALSGDIVRGHGWHSHSQAITSPYAC